MFKFKTTRKAFLPALAVLAIMAAAVGSWLSMDTDEANADPDVYVTGGGSTLRVSAEDAILAARERSGLSIEKVAHSGYELFAISLPDAADQPVKTAELVYAKKGLDIGKGQITTVYLTGRQAVVSDRNGSTVGQNVGDLGVAGLEITRLDL